MKLTTRRIETLKCPVGRRDMMVFDEEQAGLGVRVTAGGGKSFLAQYAIHGAKRRIPLGSCSAVALADARLAARKIMGEVAAGRDPAAERRQATACAKRKAEEDAFSLDTLIDQWSRLHLKAKRESYAMEAVRALRYAFGRHLVAPAAALDRTIVVQMLDRMAKEGRGAMGSRTAAYGRAAYRWAIKRGSLASNPFADLPLSPTVKRERVLDDAEIAAVWRATARPGVFNAIVRLLLLTGQRREEVAGMTWSELSGDLSTWTIPASRAKNGVAHLVPLSLQAKDTIDGALSREGTDLVFSGLRGPFNGFGKAKAKLDKDSGVIGWRLHDLRRTAATGLQKLGVRLEVTEAVLNHVAGSRAGIVGIYQRHDFAAEKRAALTTWGAYVAALGDERALESSLVSLPRRTGV